MEATMMETNEKKQVMNPDEMNVMEMSEPRFSGLKDF